MFPDLSLGTEVAELVTFFILLWSLLQKRKTQILAR